MTSKLNVLLIVNPVSGGINKDKTTKAIKNELKTNEHTFRAFQTTGKNDVRDIREMIEKYNPDRILVIGGDGTLKLAAEALQTRQVAVGIIPAGSSNGLARSLGLPDDLKSQLHIALGENLLEVDKIKINDEICLHIADLGINAELIKNYERSSLRGKLGYLMQSVPTILSCDYPFEFEIKLDEQTINKTGILLVIANARKYGTGATVNPSGSISDGTFEILLYKKLDLVEIIKTLREEVELNPDFVECYPATNAHIQCPAAVPFQVDGEFIADVSELNVALCPDRLILACPKHF
jgi:diacylglycerol kinase (ATP)